MRKRLGQVIIVLAGVLVTACVAVTGFVLLKPRAEAYLHATSFDSSAWKARSMDEGVMWPTRLRMVDDLLDRQLRNGMLRAKVEELLGPPDKTSYFHDWDLVYQLGPERGLIRIDSEWLVFRLGPGVEQVYKALVDEWYHWFSDDEGLRLGQHAER